MCFFQDGRHKKIESNRKKLSFDISIYHKEQKNFIGPQNMHMQNFSKIE